MIIKWEAGEVLFKDGTQIYDWDAGSIEFGDHWFHVDNGKAEAVVMLSGVTMVNFAKPDEISWRCPGFMEVWCPEAKEIFDELSRRLRAYRAVPA